MFSLIVKGRGWTGNTDTIDASRIFEYTETDLVDKLKPYGQLDLKALLLLPTLFVSETFGRGDQVAYVGTIIRARASGSDIALEYIFDPGTPPITNAQLQAFSTELDLQDFQFQRTHWAVKDVNLFKVLLRNLQPRTNRPTVFRVSDPESIEPTLISAMMPFHPRFIPVYEKLKSTAEAAGLRCRRADDIWENPLVIQDVVSLIDKSKLVICDCTDRNPNVFYEIGIAHTLGRETILITQSESDIPFDLRHLRYVHYLNNGEGLTELSNRLKQRIESI